MQCRCVSTNRLARYWGVGTEEREPTSALLHHGVVLVVAAAGGDGDVVEASGDQGLEDALGAGLGHRQRVDGLLAVSQGDQVAVHVALRRPPRNAQEVHATVVADRHLADRRGHWGGGGGGGAGVRGSETTRTQVKHLSGDMFEGQGVGQGPRSLCSTELSPFSCFFHHSYFLNSYAD